MQAFCNVDTTLESLGGRMPKWNKRRVTWAAQDGGFAGLSQDDVWSSIEKACDHVSNNCGLQFEHDDNRNADIIWLYGHPQGGRGGVLADMQLPNGSDSQLRGRIDTKEQWARFDGPRAPFAGALDIDRTILHELGHGIGISHLNRGNLMQPTWDINIWTFQRGDTQQSVSRYGAATTRPQPPVEPDPDTGTKPQLIIDVTTGQARYHVQLLDLEGDEGTALWKKIKRG